MRFVLLLILMSVARPAAAQFRYVQTTPTNAQLRYLHDYLESSAFLEEWVNGLNEWIEIPDTLPVRVMQCGKASAQYRPREKEIRLCFEIIENIYRTLRPLAKTQAERTRNTMNAVLFVLFHEVGHALVDVLDVPITGREEDAVDQLATWMLVEASEEDDELSPLDAALWFLRNAKNPKVQQLAFWNEHSLHQQRWYDIACLVYGSDPENNANEEPLASGFVGVFIGGGGVRPHKPDRRGYHFP